MSFIERLLSSVQQKIQAQISFRATLQYSANVGDALAVNIDQAQGVIQAFIDNFFLKNQDVGGS